MDREEECGIVIQAQDYSIHDGDGVRTTIFLAGCGLRCQWCANPESWTKSTKLAFYSHKCQNCWLCLDACPKGLDPRDVAGIDNDCDNCGACVKACPKSALKIACQRTSVDSLHQTLKRDELFFRFSGGGVTFSGGEPFLQPRFLEKLMDRCDQLGICYSAETCGLFSFSKAKQILQRCDHIYFDIKHMDSETHKRYTGVGNQQILRNAQRIHQLDIAMTIRIPFIPEVNGDVDNLTKTAIFISERLKGVHIELLPYHELGKAKYEAFKMQSDFHSFTTPDKQQLTRAYELFGRYGVLPADE